MVVPLATVWVPSQWPQPVNDKGYTEVIPGTVHRSPGIYLKAEENPGKPQLGDCR